MPGKDKTEGRMGKELDKGGGVATDITERKGAEGALRESEEPLSNIAESMSSSPQQAVGHPGEIP